MKGLYQYILVVSSILISAIFNQLYAANLTEATAISNKIILLKFIDGEITYHQIGQNRSGDKVSLFPGGRIDPTQAANNSNYSIISRFDTNYLKASSPVKVGVNQRAEQTWDFDDVANYVQTTYVYLFLNFPLKEGAAYQITANSPAINSATKTIALNFNSKTNRSEAVHVNNLGYTPNAAAKFGYVSLWMGDAGGLDLRLNSHI